MAEPRAVRILLETLPEDVQLCWLDLDRVWKLLKLGGFKRLPKEVVRNSPHARRRKFRPTASLFEPNNQLRL